MFNKVMLQGKIHEVLNNSVDAEVVAFKVALRFYSSPAEVRDIFVVVVVRNPYLVTKIKDNPNLYLPGAYVTVEGEIDNAMNSGEVIVVVRYRGLFYVQSAAEKLVNKQLQSTSNFSKDVSTEQKDGPKTDIKYY